MKPHTLPGRIVVTVVVVAAVVGAAIGGRVLYERLSVEEAAVEAQSETSTAAAEVRTLVVDYEATGSLVYEPSIVVNSPIAGTVTAIVDAGTVLSAGDVIAVVDDVPVVWFDGEVPIWRTMSVGDVGSDVAQLESALDALGFNDDANVTIDDEFTAATATMVESWQEAIGAPVTGRIELGTVVFVDDRSRVAGVTAEPGSSVAQDAELAALGTDTRVAVFSVPPTDAVTLAVGDIVALSLPDGALLDAMVDAIDHAADAWTVSTTLGQGELPDLDVVEVGLEWERAVVMEQLTIPSSALLRLDDGSYTVDVVTGERTERRPVAIGPSVGTRVAVTAGLSDGELVVVL